MVTAIGIDAGALARAARWTWFAGAAAVFALAAPALAEPGANEVIGYAADDRSGATTSWTLTDDTPYLFVPYVDTEVAGSMAAVETGADVGAILFQRPYYGSRDVGCAPELGSDARPDLRWRGATAQFSPPVDAGDNATTERFASLIVYRKDIGPPPGVLLLNRRLTLGTACRQAVHKTFFNRVFIPLAAPPEPARCYNLSGTYARDDGADITVDFAFTDRLALLPPADLDDRYGSLRHRFRVILFDGEGCLGNGGEFRSTGKEPGDIKLVPIGLRDRVRSVRIVYEGGPLAAYYEVPVAKIEAPVPQPEAPATPEAETAPETAPETVAETAPETIVETVAETIAETVAETPKDIAAPPPPSPPASPPSDTVMAKATPAPTSVPAPAPTPAPDLAPALVSKLAPAPRKSVEPAGAQARTTDILLSAALPAPRLKLPPATPATLAPAAASKTFEYPMHDIYRLNFCLRWGVDCGEPAATAWCKAQGFGAAGAWKIDTDIGSLFPTIVLVDNRVCAQLPCDGFEEITCINKDPALRQVRQSTTKG